MKTLTTRKTGLKSPIQRIPSIKPPADQVLRKAFCDHNEWIMFFNKCNTLYEENLLTTIHEAKTISVSAAIFKTAERFSCTLEMLYPTVCNVFTSDTGGIRLSDMIDLSDASSFVMSVNVVKRRFLSADEESVKIEIEEEYGHGTLPLFEDAGTDNGEPIEFNVIVLKPYRRMFRAYIISDGNRVIEMRIERVDAVPPSSNNIVSRKIRYEDFQKEIKGLMPELQVHSATNTY